MVIFHSYVSLPEGSLLWSVQHVLLHLSRFKLPFSNPTWRQSVIYWGSCIVMFDDKGYIALFCIPIFLFRERKHMIVVALASIVRLLFLCWVKPPFIVQGPTLNGRGRRNHHFLCCFNMLKALQRSWLKHFAYLKNSLIIPQKDNTQII